MKPDIEIEYETDDNYSLGVCDSLVSFHYSLFGGLDENEAMFVDAETLKSEVMQVEDTPTGPFFHPDSRSFEKVAGLMIHCVNACKTWLFKFCLVL
jgi:hypothetical protein